MDTRDERPPSDVYEALKRTRKQLDEAVGQEPGEDEAAWLRRVQAAAGSLFEVLEQHQLLAEEKGGTLLDATGQKPGLIAESKRLERDHTEMLHRATEIDDEVERQFAFQEFDIELLGLKAAGLRDILQLHLLRVDSLMYEAYFRLEGGEGG